MRNQENESKSKELEGQDPVCLALSPDDFVVEDKKGRQAERHYCEPQNRELFRAFTYTCFRHREAGL